MVDYAQFAQAPPTRRLLTPSADAIEGFADAIGDAHPWHRADGGGEAPPTYAFVMALAGGAFAFPTDGLIHAEQAFEFAAPVRAGETLVVESGLTRARSRGEGAQTTWILTWQGRGATQAGEPRFTMSARLVARPAGTPVETPAPAPPGDDTAEGNLGAFRARLDRAAIARYARASGDHNPIHLDDEVARSFGLAGIVAHGMLSMALTSRLAETWARTDGRRLTGLVAKFLAPVLAGEEVRVDGLTQTDDAVDLWLVGEDGRERVRGRATRSAPA